MIKKVFAVTATAAVLATGMSATVDSASAEAKTVKLTAAKCKSLKNQGDSYSVKENVAYGNYKKYMVLANNAKTGKLRLKYLSTAKQYNKTSLFYNIKWNGVANQYNGGGCSC